MVGRTEGRKMAKGERTMYFREIGKAYSKDGVIWMEGNYSLNLAKEEGK